MAYSSAYRITVKAPQAKVFDYIADIARHGEWGMDEMKATAENGSPPAVGARYKAEGLLMGKVNPSTVTITELDSPRRLAFDAEDSNSTFHHVVLVSAGNGGTEVERTVTMTKGPWFNPIMLTLFKGTVSKNYNGALEKLKAKLEAS